MTNKSKWYYESTRQDRITFFWIFVITVFLFVLFFLIKQGYINIGPSGGCAFERNTGLPCPTCGWTRAIKAFMGGEILTAFYIQPGAAAGCIILAVIGFFSLLSACRGVNFAFLPPVRLWQLKYIVLTIVIITGAGWAVTTARALIQLR